MLKPLYSLANNGKGGVYIKSFPKLGIICSSPGTVSKSAKKMKNVYKDYSSGGVTLGIRGKNYWFNKANLIGKILYKIL